MHDEYNVKIVKAQKARPIYEYRNIKEKLHKTNASIWFNKICKIGHLTPNYIHITVNGNNKKSTNTKNAATEYRLNQELKYSYKKKAALNQQLYNAHIICANYWQNTWFCIQSRNMCRIKIVTEIQKVHLLVIILLISPFLVFVACWVGSGLSDELITRSEES
jgi:hypothetical protein